LSSEKKGDRVSSPIASKTDVPQYDASTEKKKDVGVPSKKCPLLLKGAVIPRFPNQKSAQGGGPGALPKGREGKKEGFLNSP